MKRKFITNLGFFLVLNLIVKPIYVFGIDRVVQNTVGVDAYGTYFSLFSIALIFQIFLDLGIENFIRREISQQPNKAPDFLSSIGILKCLLFIPYALICFGLAVLGGIDPGDYLLLLLVLFNQFLASFILYLRANLGGFQLFRTESVVSVLDRGLMILIVGSLLLYPATSGQFKIEWFVMAQTGSYLIALFVGLGLLLRQIPSKRPRFIFSELIPVLRQIKPYALLVLLMAIYYRSESIWLRILLDDGAAQTGIYAHSFRILDFLSNYALLFPILLLPIFSKTLHQKQPVNGLLQLSATLLIVPSLAVLAPAVLYRKELFALLYPDHIGISANAFSILTISYLGMCISYTFGALLTANGNLMELNWMAGSAVIVSTLLNLTLIPTYGVMGAAVSNATVQVLTIVIHIILVRRILDFRPDKGLLSRLLIFLIILAVSTWIVSLLPVHWIAGSVILGGLGLGIAVLIRLVNIRDILHILRNE